MTSASALAAIATGGNVTGVTPLTSVTACDSIPAKPRRRNYRLRALFIWPATTFLLPLVYPVPPLHPLSGGLEVHTQNRP